MTLWDESMIYVRIKCGCIYIMSSGDMWDDVYEHKKYFSTHGLQEVSRGEIYH